MAESKVMPILTYSDTTTFRVAMADFISMLGPWEVPIVSYFGLDGSPDKFRLTAWPSTEARWFEDAPRGLTTGLAASVASDASSFAVTAADGYKFRPGDVVVVDSEYFWVSSMTTDTLTVTGGYAGSVRTTHASTSTVYIRSHAELENSSNTQGGFTIPSVATNYTQIFRDVIGLSRTEEKQSRYGIPDRLVYETAKKLKEILRLPEQSFFYGKRTAGTATLGRSFGGIETFVTTNTSNLSNAALTETALENQLQTIWEAGGSPTLAICNAFVKRKINSLYRDMVRKEKIDRVTGLVVDTIETQFGDLNILMDRYCPPTKLYLVTPDEIGFVAFDSFRNREMPYAGDGKLWEVVGEYTLIVRQDKKHGYIYGISTTS